MATLAVNTGVVTGLDPATYLTAAASGGDAFANNGSTYFHVKNDDASSINVTIGAVTDTVVDVPASGERIIGPFLTSTYNDGTGKVQITYSAVVSVTVGPVTM